MKFNKVFYALMLVVCLVLGGCASQNDVINKEAYFNAYDKINKNEVMNLSSEADVELNYGNADEMYKTAEQVVIARIDSVDGGSNYNEQTGEYIFPFTYGKMTVSEVIKGSFAVDQQINYIRMGGIITFDEYYKGLLPAEKQKLDANTDEKPKYVKRMFGEDIDIEAGKTYLVYIDEGDTEDFPLAKRGSYPIIGWEGGLREIRGNIKAESNMKVLNNITDKWEPFEKVITGK